ncbi:MAG: FMN-binding protein [Melioribacteraceae bacterium]|nr:FMN-binding protein [Melioribacteraceae bacterium]
MNLIIKMLVTLSIIGILSGGLLSQIASWAAPHIAHHRAEATKEAIFTVQPKAKNYIKIESAEIEAYKVVDADSNSIGYALVYEGSGFQGKIRLMVGLNDDLKTVNGLSILEQVETPGLGTKIVEDASNKEDSFWFPNQFKDAEYDPELVSVKGAEASKPNEIQAITGATISSKAVVLILNEGIEKLREMKNGGTL